jgi:hypothetical protein
MQGTKALPTVAAEEPEASGEVLVDRERLTYITRTLGGQQGVYTVWLGAMLLLPELGGLWKVPGGWLAGLSRFAVLAAFIMAYKRWIPRYYRRRFGHVEAQEISARQFVILLSALVALFFFGQPVARYLSPIASSSLDRVHLMISDPGHQVNLGPSFLWVALFFSSLRWRVSRAENQWLCFLLGGTLAFISIALFPIWHPSAGRLVLWRVLNAGGLGLSFIASGLYHHITLLRMLPKRVAEGDDE